MPVDTAALAQKVKEETRRFEAALPALLETMRGKWVVFRDGTVQSQHASEPDAYVAAVAKYGPHGGFVVAPVEPISATPITAGVMFGFA